MKPRLSKSSALDQAFDDPLIDFAQVHFEAKIRQRSEVPLFFPGGEDRLNGRQTYILDCGQPEADLFSHHRKILVAFVDVRGKDFDLLLPAFPR